MLHLLTSPRTARTVRGLIGTLIETAADAVRSIAPAAPAKPEPVVEIAPDPADLYEAEEMPETDVIEAAAAEHERAADQARRADRGKRAAKKILDRLPAGRYGAWIVERVTSSRETADLDSIRATYKRLGLGPVPMKRCAPSLKVRRAEVVPAAEEIALVAA
ncbi:hypothetical protein ACIQCF_25895 [Streptomyces sp. NPDC088353]|uniref:hypothetical protein n=1 Tax=Streptomyces sp. NPDC088353 TaxID=3365855 RepID=UPI00380487D5